MFRQTQLKLGPVPVPRAETVCCDPCPMLRESSFWDTKDAKDCRYTCTFLHYMTIVKQNVVQFIIIYIYMHIQGCQYSINYQHLYVPKLW